MKKQIVMLFFLVSGSAAAQTPWKVLLSLEKARQERIEQDDARRRADGILTSAQQAAQNRKRCGFRLKWIGLELARGLVLSKL
ncbi:MAG: hypothetical protein ACD_64C00300G0002 [uncultured bacterium]|nr:MAG: hypothetical protein ACD_64C00300G0002 [uncultured bacterium]HLE76381.1 hypothetical protein [Candidatus Babeliales bacterium]